MSYESYSMLSSGGSGGSSSSGGYGGSSSSGGYGGSSSSGGYGGSSYGGGYGESSSSGSYSGSSGGKAGDIASDLMTLAGSVGGSSIGEYMSQIEQSILRSDKPIEISETEELTVAGERGIWMNKQEVSSWRGDIPITDYRVHEDRNPQIINKKYSQRFEYVQELAIRYLRPPTPPAAGEIVIVQEPNVATGPAPPLIIRQVAGRSSTPEPVVYREAPPQPPTPVGSKRITISGKRLPPPPRKVVIERLAPLPSKPQNVIIERWLPYTGGQKRRVVFQGASRSAEVANPRNVIVQWSAPEVNIRKEIKYLGVIRANPAEYVQKYGSELKTHQALPEFVKDIRNPSEVGRLAWEAGTSSSVATLEGQLEAFKYINLDNEGLSEYREQLMAKGIRDLGASGSGSGSGSGGVTAAAAKIFDMIDYDRSGKIEVFEAERIVLKLNSQLNRSYGESEVKQFFSSVSGGSSQITKRQFLQAFARLV